MIMILIAANPGIVDFAGIVDCRAITRIRRRRQL